MGTSRSRSSGWAHAKLSGHINESKVESLFNDKDFRQIFEARLAIPKIRYVRIGGISETDVDSILGGKTKSKTDLQLHLINGERMNISIKKSLGGQVYLIGVNRFISGFEKQYKKTIPEDIKDTLSLYFYGNDKTTNLLSTPNIIEDQSDALVNYQIKHNRLTWDSLSKYDDQKAIDFLNWIKDNIEEITDFCFSKGLAANMEDWATHIWYINLIEKENFNDIIPIDDIKKAVKNCLLEIQPSSRNGGSTIQLPFGFVQWHQSQMQFHHSHKKICEKLIDNPNTAV